MGNDQERRASFDWLPYLQCTTAHRGSVVTERRVVNLHVGVSSNEQSATLGRVAILDDTFNKLQSRSICNERARRVVLQNGSCQSDVASENDERLLCSRCATGLQTALCELELGAIDTQVADQPYVCDVHGWRIGFERDQKRLLDFVMDGGVEVALDRHLR